MIADDMLRASCPCPPWWPCCGNVVPSRSTTTTTTTTTTSTTSTLGVLIYLCLGAALLCVVDVDAKVFATQMSATVVETNSGMIKGVLITLPNRHLPQVEAYLGIQYASIGDGELRFMPPTGPMERWDGIKVKLKFREVCPQKLPNIEEMEKTMPLGRVDHFKRLLPFLEHQKEECLNLNVYVPIRAQNETDLLPVVMFIHAETYEMGTGNAYDGSVMAAFGRVVVVTINFRLGVLGFLSTGDSNAPGNQALLDQVAALHWIKDNIRAFGGDPQEITLLGQGYGAAMVNLLLVSPVTSGKGPPKRAIIQSGSALSSWALSRDPLRYTQELAEKVNCSHFWGQSAPLLECFKSRPYEELISIDIKAPKYYSAFAPVVDGRSVLPTDVRQLMRKSRSIFGQTSVLLGVMKNEGFLFFNEDEIKHGITQANMDRFVRTYVRNVYNYHRQKIYEILMNAYTDWERPPDNDLIRDNLMELLGDGQITAPMMELTHLHSAYEGPTYLYGFSYPSRLDTYPRWAGGVHGDDLTYVFGAPLTEGIDPFISRYTRGEKMLTEAVLTYWTNFIKTGHPNTPTNQESVFGGPVKNRFSELEWPRFDEGRQEYLHIGMRPVIRHHYRGNKMALWLDLIPKIHHSDNLSPQYHLLDNYQNKSTFQGGGATRELDLSDMMPPTTTTPSPTTTPTTRRPTSRPTPPPTTASTTTTTTHAYVRMPSSTQPSRYRRSTTARNGPSATDSAALSGKDNTLSLSVTIAVGCSLLFLNILIFAGVYYQKDRMRIEMKMRQRELAEKQSELQAQESDINLKSSTGPETDTNSSSMATPPIPPSICRHQISPHVTTLSSKHAIPVLPPQPPYHSHTTPRRSPHHSHMRAKADHVHDGGMLKRSSSADSASDLNNHHGNPSTVV